MKTKKLNLFIKELLVKVSGKEFTDSEIQIAIDREVGAVVPAGQHIAYYTREKIGQMPIMRDHQLVSDVEFTLLTLENVYAILDRIVCYRVTNRIKEDYVDFVIGHDFLVEPERYTNNAIAIDVINN